MHGEMRASWRAKEIMMDENKCYAVELSFLDYLGVKWSFRDVKVVTVLRGSTLDGRIRRALSLKLPELKGDYVKHFGAHWKVAMIERILRHNIKPA